MLAPDKHWQGGQIECLPSSLLMTSFGLIMSYFYCISLPYAPNNLDSKDARGVAVIPYKKLKHAYYR